MQFRTWLLPPADDAHRAPEVATAVVIDVLRATTVATTALAAGARSVTTCRDLSEAFALRSAADAASVPLLCGERECRPIKGFDLGNSPAEYAPAGVAGRDLILTTTNGTAAIESSADADELILASFTNLSAVVDYLVARHGDAAGSGVVRLVCSGTNGEITTEDVLLAGAILANCHRRMSDSVRFHEGPVELLDDAGGIALAVWQHSLTSENVTDAASLAARFAHTQGGRNLIAAGYENDLVDCGSIDLFENVPFRVQCQPAVFTNAPA